MTPSLLTCIVPERSGRPRDECGSRRGQQPTLPSISTALKHWHEFTQNFTLRKAAATAGVVNMVRWMTLVTVPPLRPAMPWCAKLDAQPAAFLAPTAEY